MRNQYIGIRTKNRGDALDHMSRLDFFDIHNFDVAYHRVRVYGWVREEFHQALQFQFRAVWSPIDLAMRRASGPSSWTFPSRPAVATTMIRTVPTSTRSGGSREAKNPAVTSMTMNHGQTGPARAPPVSLVGQTQNLAYRPSSSTQGAWVYTTDMPPSQSRSTASGDGHEHDPSPQIYAQDRTLARLPQNPPTGGLASYDHGQYQSTGQFVPQEPNRPGASVEQIPGSSPTGPAVGSLDAQIALLTRSLATNFRSSRRFLESEMNKWLDGLEEAARRFGVRPAQRMPRDRRREFARDAVARNAWLDRRQREWERELRDG
jgi:hypothetical protein